LPVGGIANGTMARRAHLEHQRRPASADANLVTLDLQGHPFLPYAIALSRWIELLDEKVLHIGAGIRQTPANTRVVADDDEWNAGNGDARDVKVFSRD